VRITLGCLAASVTVGLLGLFAVPAAGASTPGVASGPHRYPTIAVARARRANAALNGDAAPAPLMYHGGNHGIGVTTGTPRVYVVFWGSQWGTNSPAGSSNFSNDPAGMAPRVEALFTGIGTNGELWSGVSTQYCEGVAFGATTCPDAAPHVGYATNGALAGMWYDASVAAPVQASGHQLAVEAVSAASHFGNTTAASNRDAQYMIVSPTGTHPDGFNTPQGNFCAWHDWNGSVGLSGGPATSTVGDIAFTNLPYIPDLGGSCGESFVNPGAAGALDGVTIVAGHEYTETITDQNPLGGWVDRAEQENADKWVWNGTGGIHGAQNVAFASGTFPMQATWSNDSSDCRIAHGIFGDSGSPVDFFVGVSANAVVAPAGTSTTATVLTATEVGAVQPIALSASGMPAGVSASFAPASVLSDHSSTLTLTPSFAAVPGTYDITITGTGTTVHTTSLALTIAAAPEPLGNGVPVTDLSGTAGSQQYWVIDVPAGQKTLTVTTAGGTGDVDLYVRRGSPPTADEHDCASLGLGTIESCIEVSPAADAWYVMIAGSSDYSGVTLTASYAPPDLIRGKYVTHLSGDAGSQQLWTMTVPAGRKQVVFTLGAGSGNADLYVRALAAPSTTTYDCRSIRPHNFENCTIKTPAPGTYYVMVYGAAAFTKARLRGTYP
jgi:serine protease